jgi:hypothetical protein
MGSIDKSIEVATRSRQIAKKLPKKDPQLSTLTNDIARQLKITAGNDDETSSRS